MWFHKVKVNRSNNKLLEELCRSSNIGGAKWIYLILGRNSASALILDSTCDMDLTFASTDAA